MLRPSKGKSIIKCTGDYTAIDLETTGYSPLWDEIIEIGAIKYRNHRPFKSFHTLVKCHMPLDPFVTAKTGITDEMLADAPKISDVIDPFVRFLGNDVLLGHNVGFDVNFIYDACKTFLGISFSNDHINTVRFAYKLCPGIQSRTLESICLFYQIPYTGAHRSIRDCELVHEVYEHMLAEIDDISAFERQFIKKKRNSSDHSRYYRAKDIVKNIDAEANENTDIFGRAFCFTGKLDDLTRKEAAQIVVNMGGLLTDGVTKKTNYLVLGSTDYCKSINEGKTSKQKKAEKLIREGSDLQIITEDVFYQMIEEN